MKTRGATAKASNGQRLESCLYFFLLFLWLFQLDTLAWADYQLSLKSGLQMRVRTYRIDGATIQFWTESGSMSLPMDLVTGISKIKSIPGNDVQTTSEKETIQPGNERAGEALPKQERENPLYVPDTNQSP
jgi:hypothetical protein